MSYIVPLAKPSKCNKCPFGKLIYAKPFWACRDEICDVDYEVNKIYIYGYCCTLEIAEKGKVERVLRANFKEDIPAPDWCRLKKFNHKPD